MALTSEVAGKAQGQRHAVLVQLLIDTLPGGHQYNRLGGVSTRGLEDAVDVLARIVVAGRVVRVVLAADLEADALEDALDLVIDPIQSASRTPKPQTLSHVLKVVLVDQCLDLVAVRAQDVVLAAAKVRVHLARQQRVLRDVRLARVVVERQQQQPDDADGDAEEREVRRQLQEPRVAPQREGRGWFGATCQSGSGERGGEGQLERNSQRSRGMFAVSRSSFVLLVHENCE